MRIDRVSCGVWTLAGIAAALMVIMPPPRSPLVLLNRTPSLPVGLYIRCDHQLHRGDVVAFALPPKAWSYARRRGESTHVILLKHVLARSGDFVSTLHGELRINGILIGSIASVDSAGRPLPRWTACRLLTGDELLVGSTHPRSFDSRYFGPIHVNQVLGVYRKLTFCLPFGVSNGRESRCDPKLKHPPPIPLSAMNDLADDESRDLQKRTIDRLGQVKGAAVNAARNSRVYRELGLTIPAADYQANVVSIWYTVSCDSQLLVWSLP